MAIRKKTLRRLSPEAKEVAKLANEAQSLARRLKNLAIKMNDAKWIEAIKNYKEMKEDEKTERRAIKKAEDRFFPRITRPLSDIINDL